MVAATGEQILGPTDVSLSNWTVRPSSGCSVVLATHTAGVSVDGYTLTLAANPWNVVRTCSSPAATGSARPPTLWCTCPRQTTSTTRCTAASRATRAPGARPRCTSPCRQTEWCALPGAGPAQPDGRNVYGLQILDATLEAGNTAEEEGTAASALLLKHEFLPPSPFTAPEADWPSCSPQNKNRRRTDPTPKLTHPPSPSQPGS